MKLNVVIGEPPFFGCRVDIDLYVNSCAILLASERELLELAVELAIVNPLVRSFPICKTFNLRKTRIHSSEVQGLPLSPAARQIFGTTIA